MRTITNNYTLARAIYRPHWDKSITTEKSDRVTRFYLDGITFDTWLYQNTRGVSDPYIDYIDGCLIDNFIIYTRRGVAAVYEQYLNPNESIYYVEFEPGDGRAVFDNWQQFADQFDDDEN